MEHLSKDLAHFRNGTHTRIQRITDPDPEPTLEERRERLRKSLGISSFDHTFENFDSVPGTEKALKLFKELALGGTDWNMLLCYGGVGNGKTFLCEAVAIALYTRGVFCRVMTMSGIMKTLKNAMHNPEAPLAYEDSLEIFCFTRHLIIDDVGMGSSGSEWEYGQLEEIVVMRYREQLFTIMTTNRDLGELPERITSRFSDSDVGRVVLNQGEDFRWRKERE